jgi:hypothetical protein
MMLAPAFRRRAYTKAPAFRRRAYTKAPATRQAKYKEFFMSLIRPNEMLGTRPAALFVLAEPVRQ